MNEKQLKKQKRKEKIKNIKEFLSDKRNKAIVKLGLWFIFFLLVIIYIRFMESRNNYGSSEPSTPLKETITTAVSTLKTNNYEFKFSYNVVTDVENTYIVTGKKYNDKWLFTYNDITYYYDNDLYNIVDNQKILNSDENVKYLLMFDANKIYNYLSNATYDYKKEDAEKTMSINSYLELKKFGSLINEQIDSSEKIVFETSENNNILNNIIIDFTNYYKIINENTTSFKIDIVYSNINKVEEFNY